MSKHKHFHNIKNPAQMSSTPARRKSVIWIRAVRGPRKRLPTIPTAPRTTRKRSRQMRGNPQIPILFRRCGGLQCTA